MSGLGKDSRIISRKLILFLITFHLGFTELRNGSAQLFDPCIRNMDRRKIRVREVTVIFGILFGTHGVRRLFVVIPSSCLLDNGSAFFQKLDLTLSLTLDRSCNGFKRVQVLHLGSCSEGLASHLTDRKVDVGTHGTFLKFAVRNSKILHGAAELFQICDNLLGASHIRLGYDLDQRYPASVVVNQGAVFPLIMDQLTGILLHMHLMDTYSLFACGSLDLNSSVIANRQIQLRDLVVLGVIRVKIVLTVKLAVLMDMAICRKTCLDGKLYHFFIEDRKRSRHTGADRAGMCIWCTSELCGASAEDLCFCGKLHMHLKSYDCLILFHAFSPPSIAVPKSPRFFSYACAARNRLFSLKQSPIIWIPIGSPAASFPHGTVIPGSPHRFTATV